MTIIFIRTLIIFVSLIVFMRLLGKRQLRELELSELVVSVLLADLAAIPMQDTGIPLVNGLIPIVTLFACELIISGGMLANIKFRTLMCGKPEVLIKNGVIQEKEMRKSRLSLDELFEELRSKEILDISTVQYAVLETDGTLNTILMPAERPVTAAQMEISPEDCGYPLILIEDGVLLEDNLLKSGKEENWLKKIMKDAGCKTEKDVFILILYANGKTYCLPKVKDDA